MIAALSLLSLAACSVPAEDTFERGDTVRVTFVDDGRYRVEGGEGSGNTFSVKTGEDLTVTVTPEEGLFLSDADYAGSASSTAKLLRSSRCPA